MLVALRKADAVKEDNRTVTVNSLGFAGTFAVKKEDDLEIVKKYGPIGILERVSEPVQSN